MAVLCPTSARGISAAPGEVASDHAIHTGTSAAMTTQWRHLALYGLLSACALGAASAPASVAVHMTMLREDAGRPVRPVGDILLWGTLALSVELTACLALL